MLSLNEVTVAGFLGRDPDIRTTQNGDQVANCSVATTERWKDGQGQKQERTDWHRVVVWGPLVQVVQQYTRKGSSVLFRGQLRTRKWTDQQGQDRYVTEIYVSGPRAMVLLNDPPTGSQQPHGGGGYPQHAPPNQGGQGQPYQQPQGGGNFPGAGAGNQPPQGGSPYGGGGGQPPHGAPNQGGQPPQGGPYGNLDDEIPF